MHTSLNKVDRIGDYFVKVYGYKRPYFKYFYRVFFRKLGLNQPVEYGSPNSRKNFEKQVLELWANYHLNVPVVIRTTNRSLCMSYIEGDTIDEKFRKAIDFQIVEKLFYDMNDRHALAFKHQEPLLCHIDSNLRNLIYSDNQIFHIDFEMGRKYEGVEMWAQREATKLLISLSQVASEDSMQKIIHKFLDIYTHRHVYENFIKLKIGKRSHESIAKKIKKNGYTLINLAVEIKEYLNKRTND